MSSEDEDMECDQPEVFVKTNAVLLSHTMTKYNQTYQQFLKWNQSNGNRPISENVLLEYLEELATRSKPTTLIATYSMLKSTYRANNNIDIGTYSRVIEYLKEKSAGYKPAKSKILTHDEIFKFITEAPDYRWLDVKVMCAFAVNGAYKEVLTVTTEHVKRYDDLFLVTVPQKADSPQYTFPIIGPFVDIIQQYVDLRPANAPTNRFFLNYHREKCTTQPIGKGQFNGMARRIAEFLKLPEPERYSRYSFRKSSSLFFNTNTVNQNDEAQTTERIELDYQARPMKKSSFSYTRSPDCAPTVSRNTSTNVNETGHICTFSCGRAQCALDENEKSVLHAFEVMKPPEYTITDVTPAVYPSQPACRWIVAYVPNDDSINTFSADEAFENITRSIPYNVQIDQKYIRGTTSQKSAAYVVVYGVKCRCHKETTEDLFNFVMNEVKCEEF